MGSMSLSLCTSAVVGVHKMAAGPRGVAPGGAMRAPFAAGLLRVARPGLCSSQRSIGTGMQVGVRVGRRVPTRWTTCAASAAGEGEVGHLRLLPIEDVEAEKAWVAGVLRIWMDEEWTPLECHREIGEAVSEIYISRRRAGDDDIGSIILAIGSGLIEDQMLFMESFTDSFEVANKLSELLMLRLNMEVCCTEEDAACTLQRWTQELAAEDASN